jgi:hypothetical protein
MSGIIQSVKGMTLKQTHDMHGVTMEDFADWETVVPFLGSIETEQIKIE